MSITTKTGDKGMTSLYWGGRVSKDDERVEFYGSLDELCSFLGMAKSLIKERKIKKTLESIQRNLFTIGAEAATEPKFIKRIKERINKRHIDRLQELIKEIESKNVFEACCFYLPGENFISSVFDVVRTIARRTERKLVTLKRKRKLINPNILVYLNRLSDLLFLLARVYEKKHRKL